MSLKESAYFMKKIVKCHMPELHVKIERWKYYTPLDCYISNFGRIKDKEGQIQTVCKRNGYIWHKGKPVHRMVMEAFCPTPGYANLTVDHINHNTYQNDIWNLRWMTEEENKKQDKQDKQDNAPIEEEKNAPVTSMDVKDFMLNTVKLTAGEVRRILVNDKSIKQSGGQGVDKAMNKAINTKGPMSYGNFTLQYIGGSNE